MITYEYTIAFQGDALGPHWLGTPYLQAGIMCFAVHNLSTIVIALYIISTTAIAIVIAFVFFRKHMEFLLSKEFTFKAYHTCKQV